MKTTCIMYVAFNEGSLAVHFFILPPGNHFWPPSPLPLCGSLLLLCFTGLALVGCIQSNSLVFSTFPNSPTFDPLSAGYWCPCSHSWGRCRCSTRKQCCGVRLPYGITCVGHKLQVLSLDYPVVDVSRVSAVGVGECMDLCIAHCQVIGFSAVFWDIVPSSFLLPSPCPPWHYTYPFGSCLTLSADPCL